MFFNHYVSRDGSSLETQWLKNIGMMDKVQKIHISNAAPSSKHLEMKSETVTVAMLHMV
jgi:hypothetical protein